ncbi:uncharacterized protein LOC135708103 [Ochlerotatus camptorhynchus]|uniref:uncharacterized protein LOC135708103 n=1 Tax=Ochlerotatus camptorhynchus TaxID=644619 RepID=UPI0031DA395C
MGGAWERLVQSVKVAMGVAYSDGKLDEEGLQTLVVEAEGIVNSRPLTYLPLDAEDSEALTPNHFLLGNSTGVKQPAVTIKDHAGFQRETWRQIQRQIDVFWQRWLKEYLPVIRRQTKWFSEVRAMREGDLVMIAEDGVRNGWVRGRVDRVIQDKEGRVRQAFVRTSSGMLRRPASKLAVLDVGNDSSTVLGDAKMHPGEDVTAAAESATLPSVEALRE